MVISERSGKPSNSWADKLEHACTSPLSHWICSHPHLEFAIFSGFHYSSTEASNKCQWGHPWFQFQTVHTQPEYHGVISWSSFPFNHRLSTKKSQGNDFYGNQRPLQAPQVADDILSWTKGEACWFSWHFGWETSAGWTRRLQIQLKMRHKESR